jgi:hypothetical protein
MTETMAETMPTTSTPAASTAPTTTPTPDATTAPDAAPTGWFIMQTREAARVVSVGADTLSAELHLRAHGLNADVAAAGKALGRTSVNQKVRLALDANDPKIARFLVLKTEADVLDLETHRVAAKLLTAEAQRAEILLEATPGFAHEVARMDVAVAPLQSRASALASASIAISSTVKKAREEALAVVAAVDATVHNREFSAIRRRKEELVARLPALLSETLTQMAVCDRAYTIAMAPSLPAGIEAMLDELALAAASAPLPAVVSAPPAETAPVASAETPEASQCEARRKDGQQCNGRSLAGTTRCVLHNPGKRDAAAPAETALAGGSW